MNRRQQGARIKQIVSEYIDAKKISVCYGRGTAYNWVTIKLSEKRPDEKTRDIIEKRLLEEKLCGRYFSDCIPGKDEYNPCVLWEEISD